MLTLLLMSLAAAGGEIGAPHRAPLSWAPTLLLTPHPQSSFQG